MTDSATPEATSVGEVRTVMIDLLWRDATGEPVANPEGVLAKVVAKQVDHLLAAITAAGYRIVRDDPAMVRVPLDLAQSILAEWGSFIPTTADYEQLQEIVNASGVALSESGRDEG